MRWPVANPCAENTLKIESKETIRPAAHHPSSLRSVGVKRSHSCGYMEWSAAEILPPDRKPDPLAAISGGSSSRPAH
jgi:hypothetical protein